VFGFEDEVAWLSYLKNRLYNLSSDRHSRSQSQRYNCDVPEALLLELPERLLHRNCLVVFILMETLRDRLTRSQGG
jgi:hypothetical protein